MPLVIKQTKQTEKTNVSLDNTYYVNWLEKSTNGESSDLNGWTGLLKITPINSKLIISRHMSIQVIVG